MRSINNASFVSKSTRAGGPGGFIRSLILMGLVIAARVSNASTLTYHLEGTFSGILTLGSVPCPAALSNQFSPGQTWTLDYTCDSQAQDMNPSSPNIGYYPNGGLGLTLNVGGGTYFGAVSGGVLAIYVYDNFVNGTAYDELTLSAQSLNNASAQQVQFPTIAGLRVLAIETDLRDDTATALSSDQLPSALTLDGFAGRTFFMDWAVNDYNGTFYRVLGTVESVAVIPEPGSALVLILGMFVLASRPLRTSLLRKRGHSEKWSGPNGA
jgi:hypothetical protein